ncbi:MAG: glycosyltransferase family 4 protein [Nitrososphaerales archaeon]
MSKADKERSICFVLPNWNFRYPAGGADIVYQLAHDLAEDGISVTVIHINDTLGYLYHATGQGIFRPKRGAKRFLLSHSLTRSVLRLSFKLTRKTDYNFGVLRKVKMRGAMNPSKVKDYDTIVATGWQTAYFVNEYLKTHNPKRAFYLVQHSEDDPSFSEIGSSYASKTYDFPLEKLVINQKVFSRFKDEGPRKFDVGIDTSFFKISKGIEERDPGSLLVPLKFSKSKGAKFAIEAMNQLKKDIPRIRFSSYGDLERSEVPDYVDYYSVPSRKKLRELYNDAAIFILPSLIEGFGLPGLEAMACGACVIATANGGSEEYLENGINGLLVPTGDSFAIQEAVRQLISDVDLRIKLAQSGVETAKKFTFAKMYDEFKKLLDQES